MRFIYLIYIIRKLSFYLIFVEIRIRIRIQRVWIPSAGIKQHFGIILYSKCTHGSDLAKTPGLLEFPGLYNIYNKGCNFQKSVSAYSDSVHFVWI